MLNPPVLSRSVTDDDDSNMVDVSGLSIIREESVEKPLGSGSPPFNGGSAAIGSVQMSPATSERGSVSKERELKESDVKDDDIGSVDTSRVVIFGVTDPREKESESRYLRMSRSSMGSQDQKAQSVSSGGGVIINEDPSNNEEDIVINICKELLVSRGEGVDLAVNVKEGPLPGLLSSGNSVSSPAQTTILILELAKRVMALRESLSAALGTRKQSLWDQVEEALESAESFQVASPPEGASNKLQESLETLQKTFPLPECVFARNTMKQRETMESWTERIEKAVKTSSRNDISAAMNAFAHSLEKGPTVLKTVYYPHYSVGKRRLEAVCAAIERLETALKEREPKAVRTALRRCKALKLQPQVHPQIEEAEKIMPKLYEVRDILRQSLNIPHEDQSRPNKIKQALIKAEDLGMNTAAVVKEARAALFYAASRARLRLAIDSAELTMVNSKDDTLRSAINQVKEVMGKGRDSKSLLEVGESLLKLRELAMQDPDEKWVMEAEKELNVAGKYYPNSPIVVAIKSRLPSHHPRTQADGATPPLSPASPGKSILRARNKNFGSADLERPRQLTPDRKVRFDPSTIAREKIRDRRQEASPTRKPRSSNNRSRLRLAHVRPLPLKLRRKGKKSAMKSQSLSPQPRLPRYRISGGRSTRKDKVRIASPVSLRKQNSSPSLLRKDKRNAAIERLAMLNPQTSSRRDGTKDWQDALSSPESAPAAPKKFGPRSSAPLITKGGYADTGSSGNLESLSEDVEDGFELDEEYEATPQKPMGSQEGRRSLLEKGLVSVDRASNIRHKSSPHAGKIRTLEILELRHEVKMLKRRIVEYQDLLQTYESTGEIKSPTLEKMPQTAFSPVVSPPHRVSPSPGLKASANDPAYEIISEYQRKLNKRNIDGSKEIIWDVHDVLGAGTCSALITFTWYLMVFG